METQDSRIITSQSSGLECDDIDFSVWLKVHHCMKQLPHKNKSVIFRCFFYFKMLSWVNYSTKFFDMVRHSWVCSINQVCLYRTSVLIKKQRQAHKNKTVLSKNLVFIRTKLKSIKFNQTVVQKINNYCDWSTDKFSRKSTPGPLRHLLFTQNEYYMCVANDKK